MNYKYNVQPNQQTGEPVGFAMQLIPELQGTQSFQTGMQKLADYVSDVRLFLKNERKTKKVFYDANTFTEARETRWKLCRQYFDMCATQKYDSERLASIFTDYGRETNEELNHERAAVIRPVVYEAVQQCQARLVGRLIGSGPRYVEVMGRETNDVGGAHVYEEVANYQHYFKIPTTKLANDWINRALVEGTGIMARLWDYQKNCPKDTVLDNHDYWFDPEGDDYREDRWQMWRMRPTVGDLIQGRAQGLYGFGDEDMIGASQVNPAGERLLYNVNRNLDGKTLDPNIRVVLDLFMEHGGRWIYVVNECLVIAVAPPSIPASQNEPSRYPISVYTPLPRPGDKYGISMSYLMLDSQDLTNSILYMMNSNIARNALGILLMDQRACESGKEIVAGKANIVEDPRNSVLHVPLGDITPTCINAMEYILNRVADPGSGVTASLRGQQVSANQTAFSVNALQQQGEARLENMTNCGREAVTDYFIHGLLLNQIYLQQMEDVRISGTDGVWRGVSGQDLFGVAGKDLMPTGFPFSGSKTWWTQQGMNLVGMVNQTLGLTGKGNPIPLMRKILETAGWVATDQIYPREDMPGQDPQQENELFAQGQFVPLSPNDDDVRHIATHQPFVMWMETQGLAMANPKVIQNAIIHLQNHFGRYQQTTMQMQQVPGQQAGQGAPGLNTQMPAPKPKTQTQVEGRNASER